MSDLTEAQVHDMLDAMRLAPFDSVAYLELLNRVRRMDSPARKGILGVVRERLLREWRNGEFKLRGIAVWQASVLAVHMAWAWLARHKLAFPNAFRRLKLFACRVRFAWTDGTVAPVMMRPVSVVIPVYNGYDVLQRLCGTLFEHTDPSCRIIFVDDASPDGRIRPYLAKLAVEHDNVKVVVNERNIGFPGTVNAGVAACAEDFVILNTDTEVPKGWIPRLFAPIWSDSRVASTMPLTCDWPDSGIQNPGVVSMDELARRGVADVDQAVSRIVPDIRFCESRSNLGFCLAISREAWVRVGPFDADVFGFGYHEESDWCARARYQFGYSHKIAANVFVAHWHNGSFSSERRKAQIARNKIRLASRNPQRGFDGNPFYEASRKAVAGVAKEALAGCPGRELKNG